MEYEEIKEETSQMDQVRGLLAACIYLVKKAEVTEEESHVKEGVLTFLNFALNDVGGI
jgi:hypothetical protein